MSIDHNDDDTRQSGSPEPDPRLVVDTIPAQVWRAGPDGAIHFVNQRWIDYTGLALEQSQGWAWTTTTVIHPDDLPDLLDTWRDVLASGQPGKAEARVRRLDGEYRWFLIRAVPLMDEVGTIVEWFGTNTDIEDQKRAEALLAEENRLLEMLAQGQPLESILDGLCRMVEGMFSGSFVSILLLNPKDNRLWYGARGGLPKGYTAALNGVAIGPLQGSCGAAAYRNEPVIVSDIAVDPLWVQYRDVALAHGLRACWSTPIRSSGGSVLGTFAILSLEPGNPTAQHHDIIEQVTHLASIAIERTRTEEELRRSEAYLSEAQRLSRTGSFGWNVSTGELVWSDGTYCIVGYDRDVKPTLELVLKRVHPEDVTLVQETLDRASRDGTDLDFEHRFLLPDGSVKHVHVWAHAESEQSTGGLEFVGAVMDVTAAKQAQQALEKAFNEIQTLKDQLQQENIALREQVDKTSMFEEIVGASPALRVVLSQIAKVGPTDSTVLITGETGTGKELVARAIHKRSARSDRAFVSVNCAAIPSTLIASELFGHEKGAFTGALQRRLGRFELAEGGTIFLDEVGELPAETQLALLRVLQEREFERVGGSRLIRVDVRVIAATNRDLQAAVAEKAFRADLFYRLNVFPVEVPALRERRADIPLLVEYFVHRFAKRAGKRIEEISRKTLDLMQGYPWPGNIRELQNVIERAVIISDTEKLSVDESWLAGRSTGQVLVRQPLSDELVEHERARVEAALAESKGRVSGSSGAAARLGIPRSTLESKIRSLGLNKHRFKTN